MSQVIWLTHIHDSFVYMYMTHSFTWYCIHAHTWHVTHSYAWLSHIGHVIYMWRGHVDESLIYMTPSNTYAWPTHIHEIALTRIRDTWLTHTHDSRMYMTHSYDLCHVCEWSCYMTHSYAWLTHINVHGSLIYLISHAFTYVTLRLAVEHRESFIWTTHLVLQWVVAVVAAAVGVIRRWHLQIRW